MDKDERGMMFATRWSVMELSFVYVLADLTFGFCRVHPSYSFKQITTEEMIAKGILHLEQIPLLIKKSPIVINECTIISYLRFPFCIYFYY